MNLSQEPELAPVEKTLRFIFMIRIIIILSGQIIHINDNH